MNYHVGPELNGRVGEHILLTDKARVRLAVVAEKGARSEVAANRPLWGTTGQMVRRHLSKAGIDPAQVWLSNSVHDFDDPDANPTQEDLIREQPRLFAELASLPGLNCILALGARALGSLSNFQYVDVGNRRGSKLPTLLGVKMVPSYHPSFYVQGNWEMQPIVQFDVNRAVRESTFKELKYPQRTLHINPTFAEALNWFDHVESMRGAVEFEHGPLAMFDIESVKGRYGVYHLTHFGFGNRPDEAFCVPLTHTDRRPWWTENQEILILRRIQRFLYHENWTYSGQNVVSDCRTLRRAGIVAPYMHRGFDTMLAHRLVAPGLPHSLQFLCSIYTDEPYYKDEGGRNEKFTVSDDQFQLYNCKDVATQVEAAVGLRADLKELGMLDYFYEHIMGQWQAVFFMWEKGFKVNTSELGAVRGRVLSEAKEHQAALQAIVGWLPNDRSKLDMAKVLQQYSVGVRYSDPSRNFPGGQPKTSEADLIAYAQATPNFQPVERELLAVRERKTLLSGFLGMALDPDAHYHASYDIAKTKSQRLASEGADEGGPQMLNMPQPLRHIFIPSSGGNVLTTGDLAQAEKLVCAFDAQDMFFINLFYAGKDLHRGAGVRIYFDWLTDDLPSDDLLAKIEKICPDCVAKGEQDFCVHAKRFLSKQSNHAFDYLLGPDRFRNFMLAPLGVFLSRGQAERIRDRIIGPAMRHWQNKTLDTLKSRMSLTNCVGVRRNFFGLPDREMHGDALSWLGSSPVSFIVNRAMRIVHYQLTMRGLRSPEWATSRLVHQWYDAITVEHPPALTDQVIAILKAAMTYRLNFHGRELIIPVETKTAFDWAGKRKWVRGQSNTMLSGSDF